MIVTMEPRRDKVQKNGDENGSLNTTATMMIIIIIIIIIAEAIAVIDGKEEIEGIVS